METESPTGTPLTYATPREVRNIEQCWFYHRMELPGVGVVGGQWDLRGQVDDYLGRFDFQGKRVLDVGAASGFLTFEMEKRGASVVSFDMLDNRGFNLLPFASQKQERNERVTQMADFIDRMKNSYWFAHHALNSRAKVYYGNIHDLPQALGRFDVVLLAQILVHLRDPLGAILSASRLSSDAVVLTEGALEDARPIASFIPRVNQGPDHSWWCYSLGLYQTIFNILDFVVTQATPGDYTCIADGMPPKVRLWTLIARRRSGPFAQSDLVPPHRSSFLDRLRGKR